MSWAGDSSLPPTAFPNKADLVTMFPVHIVMHSKWTCAYSTALQIRKYCSSNTCLSLNTWVESFTYIGLYSPALTSCLCCSWYMKSSRFMKTPRLYLVGFISLIYSHIFISVLTPLNYILYHSSWLQHTFNFALPLKLLKDTPSSTFLFPSAHSNHSCLQSGPGGETGNFFYFWKSSYGFTMLSGKEVGGWLPWFRHISPKDSFALKVWSAYVNSVG